MVSEEMKESILGAIFVIGIPLAILLSVLWVAVDTYRGLLIEKDKDHKSSLEVKNCVCNCNHCPDYHEDLEKRLSKSKDQQ
ncbi:unnamed protein product [Arabis nemorensis]|uniref:Uncharacterized protein n=1 Tax=Arabis nemorensis TaxID=586526 RepID=A0A565CVI4_9BRAS|nr:unnamed protein product [Arabis nemorensis]